MRGPPTLASIEAAYQGLLAAGLTEASGLSVSYLWQLVLGEHRNGQATPTEERLAGSLLVAAWLVEQAMGALAVSLDESTALDRIRHALELGDETPPPDVAIAVEQLVADDQP